MDEHHTAQYWIDTIVSPTGMLRHGDKLNTNGGEDDVRGANNYMSLEAVYNDQSRSKYLISPWGRWSTRCVLGAIRNILMWH